MSLPKQLLLLLSAMFFAIFAANFVTSVKHMRDYLDAEAGVHAQDTANSLGISLSHYIADNTDPMIDTLINSVFDSGYYHEIVLLDPLGVEVIRKRNPATLEGVPHWFTSALPMTTAQASSELSAGWKQGGTLRITINPGIAYQKLWQQANYALLTSLAAFAVALIVLFVLLQFMLRPLARIDRFAHEIAEGHFGTLQPLPWTTEIRNVARSMNLMSNKLRGIVGGLNSRLQELDAQLHVDALTGLESKSTFDADIKQSLMAKNSGWVLLLHVDDLGAFARERGDAAADAFLTAFASALDAVAREANGKAYRRVGAEFAIVVAALDAQRAEQLCDALVNAFGTLSKTFDKPNIGHFGAVPFDQFSSAANIVAAGNEAFEKARLVGPNSFVISANNEQSRSTEQWHDLVARVIDNEDFQLKFTNRAGELDTNHEPSTVLEEVFTTVHDELGQAVPIGTFISVAESNGKIAALDTAVVRKAIAHIRNERLTHRLAVNLSSASIADIDFRKSLFELQRENADLSHQIVFCITAFAASKDLPSFTSFVDFVHRSSALVMLKRYETRFIPLDSLGQYKLDFLRLANVYTAGIHTDERKRRLVESMRELGDVFDIRIIAEQVSDDADLDALRSIGLYAASR